jgi:hypothetical protein
MVRYRAFNDTGTQGAGQVRIYMVRLSAGSTQSLNPRRLNNIITHVIENKNVIQYRLAFFRYRIPVLNTALSFSGTEYRY